MNMDAPSASPTNILKIDKLERIPYCLYTPSAPAPSSVPPTPISPSPIHRDINILRDAERTLRSEGNIVLSELSKNLLWVFQVEGPGIEEKQESSGPQASGNRWSELDTRLRNEWKLNDISTGAFLASSLTRVNPPPLSATPQTSSASASTPLKSEPMTIDLTQDEDEPNGQDTEANDIFYAYRQFIAAVRASIAFMLALREGYTPLNSRSLVSPNSLPTTLDRRKRQEKRGRDHFLPYVLFDGPAPATPVLLTIDAYLTSLGTLVILPHSETQSAIRRVGTCGLIPACLENREVFIAPWGEWGRLVPAVEESTEENPMVRKRREEKWKSKVVSYLQDRGVLSLSLGEGAVSALQEAVEEGEWRHVEIWLRSLADPSTGDLYRILWPSALLFLRTSEGDRRLALPAQERENPEYWKALFEDPEYVRLASGSLAMDLITLDVDGKTGPKNERDLGVEWWDVPSALAFAEDWLKARPEREKMINARIEEKRRQEEEEVRQRRIKEKQPQPSDVVPAEEKDKVKGRGLPEIKVPADGVYPTPPDAAATVSATGPTSVASTGAAATDPMSAPTSATLPAATDMDLDLGTFDVDGPREPLVGRKESDALPPAPMGGEADLFGRDMDHEMELFEQGIDVNDDEFDFFNQPEPSALGGFDGVSGGGGVDMGLGDIDMEIEMQNLGSGNIDLPMESPPVPVMETNQQLSRSTQQSVDRQLYQQDSSPIQIKKSEPENQVQTPPLSPHRAIKLLVPGYNSPEAVNGMGPTPPTSNNMRTPLTGGYSGNSQGSADAKRKMSLYSPLAFSENIEMTDRKYAPGGRFFLSESIKEEEQKQFESSPGALSTRPPASLKRKRGGFVPSSTLVAEVSLPPSGDVMVLDNGDSSGWESETESSDADDSSDDENNARYYTSPVPPAAQPLAFTTALNRKRKRALDDDGIASVASGASRDVGTATELDIDVGDLAPPPWERMLSDPTELSLAGVFEDMTLTSEALALASLGDLDYLAVASVVADQMSGWINSTWKEKSETADDCDEDEETCLIRRRRKRDQSLVEEATRAVFKPSAVVRCTLDAYATIADAVPTPPPLPPPPPPQTMRRPNMSQRRNKDPEVYSSVFRLPPPHVHLHRADTALEIMSAALNFWDTFGFSPCSGPKNSIAFCFHPAVSSLAEGADYLLDRISGSYEAGRFGTHVRAQLDNLVKDGLVPIDLPSKASQTYEVAMNAVLSTLERYGANIAHGVADEHVNIIIYVVNPFSHPSALVDISAGFVRMRRAYEAAIAALNVKPNHLTLQIIPAAFTASKLGPVLRVNVYHRLAVEVYSRTVPTEGFSFAEARQRFSPAIHLSRPRPRLLEFRSTATPSPALLRENEILHIAYTQSVDERWVSVAWNDASGNTQKTALINLSRQNSSFLRPFMDVCGEIWTTTNEIISRPAIRWRLAITKLGGDMLDDEKAIWTQFVNAHSRIAAVYLLSASLDAGIDIEGGNGTGAASSVLDMSGFNPTVSLYTTPPVISTPTPGNTVSPDAFGSNMANTPGGSGGEAVDLDPDAVLVDGRDECWGVLLKHAPASGELGIETDRGLGAGLIICKEGESGWTVAVRLTVLGGRGFCDVNEVVKEILVAWRGLAVVGGFYCGEGGVGRGVPWHLARVRDAVKVARVM